MSALDQEFMRDPLAFLRQHWMTVNANNPRTGACNLTLENRGGNIILDVGSPKKDIPCFFLKTIPSVAASEQLRGVAAGNFFFTDTLTGCQFLAWGAVSTPTVEHDHPSITGGLDARRTAVLAAPGQHIVVRPTDYTGSANVVGWCPGTQWQFICQTYNGPGTLEANVLNWQ
jgi:hypothetical protein